MFCNCSVVVAMKYPVQLAANVELELCAKSLRRLKVIQMKIDRTLK
jgi:hypothetical protein